MDNPFSYEDGINDCDVIKYNGEYYITGNWLGGDMFRSRNLTDWGERTHVFSWNNTWHVQRSANPDSDIHGTHIACETGYFTSTLTWIPHQAVSWASCMRSAIM